MTTEIRESLRPALVMLVLFTVLTGIAYPLAVTGAAQVIWPWQANGSLITDAKGVRGSALIGQAFARDDMFHGRPSAAGTGYDATASSGSNFAPGSPDLAKRIAGDVATLRKQGMAGPVPVDLVTTSASGLDPDVSPAAALAQVPRVARARRLSEALVTTLVRDSVETPFPAFLGEPHVNVVALNRALAAIGRQTHGTGANPRG